MVDISSGTGPFNYNVDVQTTPVTMITPNSTPSTSGTA